MSNATADCSRIFSSDTKCDIILGFRRALGILSMICCVFIVFVIVLFKKYKFLSQRLIMYLSIASFFQAIGYVMGDYHISYRAQYRGELEGLCIFQGVWVLFFDWVSFLWVCCITFNIVMNAVFQKRTDKFEKFYFVVDIGLPVVICCFPFIGLSYGPAGLWCWIRSQDNDGDSYTTGIVLQFLTFYIPFWVLCIVLIVTLTTVFCIVHRRAGKHQGGAYDPTIEAQKKLWKEEVKPLMLFPWIYIFILVFPSMNRLRYAAGFDDPDSGANFFFWFMHAITLTLHGTVYALVFGCDKQTLSRLKWNHIKAASSRWLSRTKMVQEYQFEQPNILYQNEESDILASSKPSPGSSNPESGSGITNYRKMDE